MKSLNNRYEHDEDINLIDNPEIVKYANNGNLDKVKELLASGVNPDSKYNNVDTALIEASRYNHLYIVKELLKHNADVNVKNNYSNTALILASLYGYLDIVKELLKYNANVNVNVKNNYGKTAFDYAKGKVKEYFISQGITK